MFCIKCGKELSGEFCSNCGTKAIIENKVTNQNVINNNDPKNETLLQDNSNDYVLNGQMTLDDFAQFNFKLVKQNIISPKNIIIQLVVIISMFVYSSFILKNIISTEMIIIGILTIEVLVWVIILSIYKSKVVVKKAFNSNIINHEQQMFSINKNNIIIKTASQMINLSKNEIRNIFFDDNSIYIMIGVNQGFIIKDRYCKNMNEFYEIKEYIIKYFKN